MGLLHRHRQLTPYLLLAPGLLWLGVFFVVPLGFLAYQSLQSGNFDIGYSFTWAWGNYWTAVRDYRDQFIRSLEYAGIATVLALWGVVLSTVYMLRAYRKTFMGNIREQWQKLPDLRPALRVPVMLLVAPLLCCGFFPQFFVRS